MLQRSRVLIVDDDPAVRDSLVDELSAHFSVVSASSGEEALEALGQERFDALVSDVRMPGMGGIALLERAARIDPALVRIFLTGYADEAVYESAKTSGAYKLRKPWGDELDIVLRNAICHRRQLDGMRSELRGYVTVSGGSPDGATVSAGEIVEHLETSLRGLPWVTSIEIRSAREMGPGDGMGDDELDRPSWFDVLGPSIVPGAPDQMEHVTWMGTGSRRYRVRVVWRIDADMTVDERVVELALRHAAEALRMRDLTDEVRARSAELEAARLGMSQRDRLAALGALAASVAHDIRSPLSVLKANHDFLGEQPRWSEDPDLSSVIDDNQLAIQMIEGIVDSMRTFAAPPSSHEAVRIARVLEVTAKLLRYEMTRAGVTLEAKVAGDPMARGTSGEVCQILVNLVTNAVQASGRGSVIRVQAVREDDLCVVTVSDQGSGVPEDARERIFAPFHTTKSGGMGLGLAISRQLARRYGGELRLCNEHEGPGACFELSLPTA